MILIGEKFHARFVLASHAGVLRGLSRVRGGLREGPKECLGVANFLSLKTVSIPHPPSPPLSEQKHLTVYSLTSLLPLKGYRKK